jgi:alpha-tubulin suppressor-like RCC1 family protein
VGRAHSCAIDADAQLWCWGQGDEGQIGDGDAMDRPAPVRVSFGTSVQVTAVAAGGAHTCAIVTGAQVACWGRAVEGQIAVLGKDKQLSPVTVSFDGASDVVAGSAHTCVLTVDNNAACWGANDFGQLGNGITAATPAMSPAYVSTLPGIAALAAGGAHTCARLLGGAVACWGADTSGQLGDGVVLSDFTPALARIACD